MGTTSRLSRLPTPDGLTSLRPVRALQVSPSRPHCDQADQHTEPANMLAKIGGGRNPRVGSHPRAAVSTLPDRYQGRMVP